MSTTVTTVRAVASPSMVGRSLILTRLSERALILTLCLSITAPVVHLSSALPWFKIEQLALPLVFLVYLWLLLAGAVKLIKRNALISIGLIYTVCILVSLLYGWIFLGQNVIINDLYEIPKALFPAAFFTWGLETDLSAAALRKFLWFFSFSMLLICLYAWAQWMDLPFSHLLASLYSGGAHDEGALSHYRRVYSTMGNPNMLGQLLTWANAAFVLAAIWRIGNRFLNCLMSLACLITLVMTGSRYGLLNTAVVFLLIVLDVLRRPGTRRLGLAILLLLIAVFGGSLLYVAKSNTATQERFESLRNPLRTDSFRDRLDNLWREAGEQILVSPFFGRGPAKALFADVVTDSEYLDVLKQFGVVGFLVYLGYYFVPLAPLRRALKLTTRLGLDAEQHAARLWAIQLSLVLIFTALLMNVGMSTFYNPSLQAFLWMWMGVGVSASRSFSDRAFVLN